MKKNILKIVCSIVCFFVYSLWGRFEFSGKDSCLEFEGEHAGLELGSDIDNFSGTLKFSGEFMQNKFTSANNKVINFSGGVLQRNGKPMQLNGTFGKKGLTRADDGTVISLSGNQHLLFDDVFVMDNISITGKQNSIVGRPRFENKIVLTNADAELELILQNKLNQNIVLNGGTVVLGSDLFFKDDTFLEGDGIINVNCFRLGLPAKHTSSINNNLVFLNANDLQLNGYTTLDGTWTFSGEGLTSTLNGYGNVLDISGGGEIVVGANHSLYITGVDIKGLGASGGNIILDPTAKLFLSTTIVELVGNFFCPTGKVAIVSPNCKLVVKQPAFWIVAGGGSLDVDGVIFQYEAIGTAPIYPPPFYMMMGGSINQINGGIIQSINFDLFKGEYQFTLSAEQGENLIIGGVNMTVNTIVHFVNENPTVHKDMILNCSNKVIRYDIANPGSVVVDENVRVIVKNLIMQNFDLVTLDIRGTGTTQASFVFGDNVVFNAGRDVVLNQNNFPFQGSSEINGNNLVLTIADEDSITISGGNVLTIKNAIIKLNNPRGIRCLDDSSRIVFQNVFIELGVGGMMIDKGSVDIVDYVEIYNSYVRAEAGLSEEDEIYIPINFCTKGYLRVLEQSSLKIKGDVLFNYLPIVAGESQEASKKHVCMLADSSNLMLEHCKIATAPIGMSFGLGSLIITDRVLFYIDQTNTAASLDLGSSLKLRVNNSSSIDVDGPVRYILS